MMVEKKHITLTELAERVSMVMENPGLQQQWVVGEVSSMNAHSSGHCYMELVERNARGTTTASLRATIWAGKYKMLASYFKAQTGSDIAQGMSLLVLCTVTFHPQYGLSLNIADIDPTYTLGEAQRQRQLTIEQLRADGVWDMNREVELPTVVQRIAVISSDSAAGWGDFENQIQGSPYLFGIELFKAAMQGEGAAKSVIAALEKVAERMDDFDAVVIIRGGGSVTDLACFDNYDMCANIAQFPLPIITGIGHERDISVADMVANTALKTPTAVAAFLIDMAADCWATIASRYDKVVELAQQTLIGQARQMDNLSSRLSQLTTTVIHRNELRISELHSSLRLWGVRSIEGRRSALDFLNHKLNDSLKNALSQQEQHLTSLQEKINARNPRNILKMGYAIISKDRHALHSVADTRAGDIIQIELADGTINSKII